MKKCMFSSITDKLIDMKWVKNNSINFKHIRSEGVTNLHTPCTIKTLALKLCLFMHTPLSFCVHTNLVYATCQFLLGL